MHTAKQPSQLRDHLIDNLSAGGIIEQLSTELSTFSQIVFVYRFGCVVCAG